MRNSGPGLSVCIAALGLCACSTMSGQSEPAQVEPNWAANGWLSPGAMSDPEIIGLFVEREECEAAVADWLSRQVVGNPIHGECLPIDSR